MTRPDERRAPVELRPEPRGGWSAVLGAGTEREMEAWGATAREAFDALVQNVFARAVDEVKS